MHPSAKEQIDRAPLSPGVYILKGKGEKVLYVGKAKRLRDRLKAYVNPNREERPSVLLLVPQVESVEWVLTDTEKEALILENSLIKSHRPRYNIMLRDDKSYASLKLTKHSFPRLFVTRKIVKDGSEYFGPYASAYDLRQTLKLIQKVFKLRDCSDGFFANRSRPCLQYQIRRCTAPCVGKVTETEYSEQVREVKQFLAGDLSGLVKKLRSQMEGASQNQQYEEAATFRDRLSAVKETLEPQKIESRADDRNADAVGLAGDDEATLVKVLKVRGGRVTGTDEYFLSEPVSASEEILRAFLQQYYLAELSGREIPRELFLSRKIPDASIFETLFTEKRGTKVRLIRPERGRGLKLLRLADRNAGASLAERKRKSERNEFLLEELKQLLRLKSTPRRIEGYDISNIQGAEPYGSMVVFMDGEADNTRYRYYRIRTVKGSNDFAMLREMFERRFRKMEAEDRPDLVLVDGGKGQLRQVVEVMKELHISDISLASIAKEKELRSRSGKKYAPERIFLPGQKNPIIFVPSAPVLHLLQRVRDEAHRFGITRHRKTRDRVSIQSILERIPDIGPKRRKSLIQHFMSIDRVQEASVQELQNVPGMTARGAKSIYDFFRPTGSPDSSPSEE